MKNAASTVYPPTVRVLYTLFFGVMVELPIWTALFFLLRVLWRSGFNPRLAAAFQNVDLLPVLAIAGYGLLSSPPRLFYFGRFALGYRPGRAFFLYLVLLLSLGIPALLVQPLLFGGEGALWEGALYTLLPIVVLFYLTYSAYRESLKESGVLSPERMTAEAVAPPGSAAVAAPPSRRSRLSLCTYAVSGDLPRNQRAGKLYRTQIEELQKLGFQPLCVSEERSFPLFGLVAPLVTLPVLFKEAAALDTMLGLHAWSPVFLSADQRTIAVVSALQVNFYSFFTNGYALRTSPTEKKACQDEVTRSFRVPAPPGIDAGLAAHEAQLAALGAGGYAPVSGGHIERYAEFAPQLASMAQFLVSSLTSWVVIVYIVYALLPYFG